MPKLFYLLFSLLSGDADSLGKWLKHQNLFIKEINKGMTKINIYNYISILIALLLPVLVARENVLTTPPQFSLMLT